MGGCDSTSVRLDKNKHVQGERKVGVSVIFYRAGKWAASGQPVDMCRERETGGLVCVFLKPVTCKGRVAMLVEK